MQSGEEQHLVKEVDFLKRDKILKDDTIGFLQREKESLRREIKHYESLCAQVEDNLAKGTNQGQKIKELKLEISQMKIIMAEQRQKIRVLRESKPLTSSQQSMISELSKKTCVLLGSCHSDKSDEVKDLLLSVNMEADGGSTQWTFIDLINKAMTEIFQLFSRMEIDRPKPRVRFSNKLPPPGQNNMFNVQIPERPQAQSQPQVDEAGQSNLSPKLCYQREAVTFKTWSPKKNSDKQLESGRNSNLSSTSRNADPHGLSASAKLMQMAKRRLDSINRTRNIISTRIQTASGTGTDRDSRLSLPGLRWSDNISS